MRRLQYDTEPLSSWKTFCSRIVFSLDNIYRKDSVFKDWGFFFHFPIHSNKFRVIKVYNITTAIIKCKWKNVKQWIIKINSYKQTGMTPEPQTMKKLPMLCKGAYISYDSALLIWECRQRWLDCLQCLLVNSFYWPCKQ